jgi:dolichol kinase
VSVLVARQDASSIRRAPGLLPLLMTLPTLFDRLFGTLLFRKLYHFFLGSLTLLGLVVLDKGVFLIILTAYLLVFWYVGRRISLAALGILILFAVTDSKYTTLGAGIIFVVGDGLAALIGSKYGRTRWPWHEHKTVLGSLAFFVSSVVAMLLFVALTLRGQTQGLLLALLPPLAGCLTESLPVWRINGHKVMLGESNLLDDNLFVLLVSGIVLHVLINWLGIRVAL